MSFNVGSGLLTAHISPERLHDIKQNSSLPEMTLWEKIKNFFFSTHQADALNCLYKLYHHDELSMSEKDIRETFLKLSLLAAPGCQNKFSIDRSSYSDTYIIDSEVILVVPKTNADSHISQNGNIWHDCEEEDNNWYDCNDDENIWFDCDDGGEEHIWHDIHDDDWCDVQRQNIYLERSSSLPEIKSVMPENISLS